MRFLIAVAFAAVLAGQSRAVELRELKVLFVGEAASSRAKSFETLLKTNVAEIKLAAREGFDPKTAESFDVVILDWPQSDLARENRKGQSPLGQRENWTKPTVLVGSAGLNLAVAWKLRGGAG